LSENADDVRAAVLRVHGQDSPGVKRCIVTLLMESESARWFTIDVTDRALGELPMLSWGEVAELSNMLLDSALHIPMSE